MKSKLKIVLVGLLVCCLCVHVCSGVVVLADSGVEAPPKTLDFSKTVMDNEEKAKEVLGNALVIMTSNDAYFMDGKKQVYGEGCAAVEVEGIPLISDGLLSAITGTTWQYLETDNSLSDGTRSVILSASAQKMDETWYYPLESIATQILQKKFTYDPRGCAIIADKTYEIQRDHYVDTLIQFHDADVIYRYMQFDQVSGYEMIETLKQNMPNKKHPRLLYTDSDIRYIKTRLSWGDQWQKAYQSLLNEADAACIADNSSAYKAVGTAKQSAAIWLQHSLTLLGKAYFLSGQEKYAEKGVEILRGLITWDSVDIENGCLISGHWMAAIAIGYDSFYNYILSMGGGRELLSQIREVAYNIAMYRYYAAYCGEKFRPHAIVVQDNFSGVCGGGLLSMLIAMADEEDHVDMMAYLLENCMKTLQISVGLFYPDGGYYESVGYSTYMLGNFSIALLGMKNSFGDFYGLDEAKGFSEYGYFLTYMQTPNTNVNYHDGGTDYYYTELREMWAYLFEDPMQAVLSKRQKSQNEKLSKFETIDELFFYNKAIDGKSSQITQEKIDAMGTDRYFYSAESGAFSSSMTEANPTLVGIHGGLTGLPHDMLDLGEFIFEAEGVKWATDMGCDSYDLSEYFDIPGGYKYYLKRPEGKNCIMLNPNNTKDADGNTYYGQTVYSRAELISIDMNQEFGAFAVYDLTAAYSRDVTKYHRGYYFGDNRSTLLVQDEITFRGGNDNELYWFMQLPLGTSVTVEEGGKRALLKNNGKTLVVEMKGLNTGNAAFMSMNHKPVALPSQPGEFQINEGLWNDQQKLAIHATGLSGAVTLSVKLMPNQEKEEEYFPLRIQPMADWIVSNEPMPEDPSHKDETNGNFLETIGGWLGIAGAALVVMFIAVGIVFFIKRSKRNDVRKDS